MWIICDESGNFLKQPTRRTIQQPWNILVLPYADLALRQAIGIVQDLKFLTRLRSSSIRGQWYVLADDCGLLKSLLY